MIYKPLISLPLFEKIPKAKCKVTGRFVKSSIKNISGVYALHNIVNSRIYVGASKNLYRRRRAHLQRRLLHNNPKLRRDFQKCGLDKFIFEILEYADPSNLVEREQYWMDKLRPYYNYGAARSSQIGSKHTPQQVKQLVKAIKKAWKEGKYGNCRKRS